MLTEAGAIAAGSPVPGQLAALCHRLGVAGHGITVPPAAQIPAPWASVLAHRDAPVPADGPEVFAPLACILPDVDGARFALAGLSTAAGESHLHVVSSGMPQLVDRFAQLDAGFLLVAQGRRRELARGDGRRTAHARGRHAGVPAAADAAARRGPGRGRDRGDRTGDAGPRNGTDSPGPGTSED